MSFQIKIDYRLRPAITAFPPKGCIKKARHSNPVKTFVQFKCKKKRLFIINKRFKNSYQIDGNHLFDFQ